MIESNRRAISQTVGGSGGGSLCGNVWLLRLLSLLGCCSGFDSNQVLFLHRRPRGRRHDFCTRGSCAAAADDNVGVSHPQEVVAVPGPFHVSQLESYWGQRPLLVRGAFDPDRDDHLPWPTWDDLVNMACYSSSLQEHSDETAWDDDEDDDDHDDDETGESARLITHIPGQLDSFRVELGPFELEELQAVIEQRQQQEATRCWTVLVNDVDRYVPMLSRWMDQTFSFLPRWRRDDAQVSIASTGGGIGPHVDNYDVFLIQVAGQRKWIVDTTHKLTAAEEQNLLIPDISVSILQMGGDHQSNSNISIAELTLQTGDMLYLPPRVVHWGTAMTDDCVTLSVGCRAPSAAELVARVAETVQPSVRPAAVRRYTDHDGENRMGVLLRDDDDLCGDTSRTEEAMEPSLSQSVKESMKELVRNAVEDLLEDDLAWDALVGKVTTESVRYAENAVRPYDDEDNDYRGSWGQSPSKLLQTVRKLGPKASLVRCPGVSFATSRVKTKGGLTVDRLFADGEMWEAEHEEAVARIFHLIERGEAIDGDMLSTLNNTSNNGPMEVLEQLVGEGLLRALKNGDER